jgi:L,D-transpeptidase ErfK/SrfK
MLANPAFHKVRRSCNGYNLFIVVGAVLLLTLIVGLICGWLMLQTVASYYAGRIYPNVYVLGLKLGRLIPEEASLLLDDTVHQVDVGMLHLRDSSRGLTPTGPAELTIPWSQLGMQLDVHATVDAAFAIGHIDGQDWRDRMWEWLQRHDIAPVFSVDPEQARRTLEQLAPSLATAPVDAALRLPEKGSDRVIAVPGRPGRKLDIEATLAQLLTLVKSQETEDQLDLVFQSLPPHITDVTPFQAQAEEMLNRRVEVITYDVLTDESFSWTLGRKEFINWLRIAPGTTGPTLTLDQQAIRSTLTDFADELGAERGFRWEEATGQVANALEAGGGTVTLYLTHPVRSHIVQDGDSLSSIASAFGMTAWHVMQANPGLDPDWLYVGQELTIPSQDELTPYIPVPSKRVVVSVAEQRMRAYENGKLVFEWPVSTGVAKSPTHSGVFQVLGKEEQAYASLWDLWMPHFVAIYAAGPDFSNGFHGLPTLSSGRRLWEGLLGSPASYGCIILGLEEAEVFYNWVELGVVVVVE